MKNKNNKLGFALIGWLLAVAIAAVGGFFVVKTVAGVSPIQHAVVSGVQNAADASKGLFTPAKPLETGVGFFATISDIVAFFSWLILGFGIIGGILSFFKLVKLSYHTALIAIVGGSMSLGLLTVIQILGWWLLLVPGAFAVLFILHWIKDHKSTTAKIESDAYLIWQVIVADAKGLYAWLSGSLKGLCGWIAAKFSKPTPPTAPKS